MSDLDNVLQSFQLTETGPNTFRAPNAATGHNVVFGGQLLGQSIIAALAGHEDKRVMTLHTVFARAGRPDQDVDITVTPVNTGRSLASATVTISQGDRVCTQSSVLLTADDPDFIRHADPAPSVSGHGEFAPVGHLAGWEMRIVGDVDVNDPDLVGPPQLDVWSRWAGAPTGGGTDEALLAFASDGFLIATAMRPHLGVGQSQAHVSISTAVISHTITFHDRFDAGDWLLLSHHSPHAGNGRSYGRAAVFTEDGRLVASYVQDAMIRPISTGAKL
ncbi:MAG: thioesterase family protein [Microthrixaceae bacterium]|nr:thioesterase family protein [Microthrixaceae bacterium]